MKSPTPRDRELNAEIARIFVVNLASKQLPPADRAYLSGLVRARTGISAAADAEGRVDAAWAQVQKLKADAETTARDTAETARRSAILAAFLAGAVSLAGLAAAVASAAIGSQHRDHGTDLTFMGTRMW